MKIVLIIGWERAKTEWLISHLRRYLDLMEASLQDAAKQERSSLFATRDEHMNDGERSAIISDYAQMFEEDFPGKLRFSFLVLTYSYLESRTTSFCAALLQGGIVSGAFKKLKSHSHLASVQKYFERYEPLRLASLPWSALIDFEKLRNCIVHASGVIMHASNPKNIESILSRTPGLSRSENGEIRVDVAYIELLLDTVEFFFTTAFDAAGFYPRHDVIRATP